MTAGIDALSADLKAAIIAKVRAFDGFSAENDPYGEHDFGSFQHDGQTTAPAWVAEAATAVADARQGSVDFARPRATWGIPVETGYTLAIRVITDGHRPEFPQLAVGSLRLGHWLALGDDLSIPRTHLPASR